MSDNESTAPEADNTTPTPGDVAEATQGRGEETPEQTIEGLRAALAKANAEAKENRLKAKELDEVKQSQMSDLERAQQEAAEAAQQLTALQSQALRQKVAIEKGLPAKWVDRLRGDTEEDLAADADLILADLTPAPTSLRPDPSQGSKGDGAPPSTADQFADAISSAFTR